MEMLAQKTHDGYLTATPIISVAKPLVSEEELKRKKRIKCLACIAIFVVFQMAIGAALGLTVLKVKTPKAILEDITIHNLTNVPSKALFDTNFTTQIKIKNTNWGPYKFDAGNVTFVYNGTAIGKSEIPKGKAGMRSSKKFDVAVSLNADALPKSSKIGTDLVSGKLTVTSEVQLKGKVELMLIMKKNKSAAMNCTIALNLSAKTVNSLQCK